jgi:hypothetical protein
VTWLSFDDGYTQQRVWEDIPFDTRWHFHALVEKCGATRRYDGRLRWTDALRVSDVPDPQRSMKELIAAGLVIDHGTEVEIEPIDDFLPPEGERADRLLPRKRRNQAAYRKRNCAAGRHSKDCPPDSCPVKLQKALDAANAGVADGVTARVTGNAGTGRGGAGSPAGGALAPPSRGGARGKRAATSAAPRPPWCGHCHKSTRRLEDDDGYDAGPCPDCHPLTARSP